MFMNPKYSDINSLIVSNLNYLLAKFAIGMTSVVIVWTVHTPNSQI